MIRFGRYLWSPLLILGGLTAFAAPLLAEEDGPAAAAHVKRATELAGKDHTYPLFLCYPNATVSSPERRNTRLPPTRAFDNLYYVGTGFVGVWVLKTSEGLILFDAGQSIAEARDLIVPDLVKLGLDPRQIKYVLATHAHWDHFGGAKYFQDTFGARIGLGEPDWYLLEHEEADSPERENRPRPRRDLVITDGQKLTLGDTTVSLYLAPGHTHGTLAAIVPAREGNRVYPLSLLGGTLFPPTRAPKDRHAGLEAFSNSVERLASISSAAGAVGLINTHIYVDGSNDHLDAIAKRKAGEPNPFVVGTERVVRHYQIFDECLRAAMQRPEKDLAWSKPLPKEPTD